MAEDAAKTPRSAHRILRAVIPASVSSPSAGHKAVRSKSVLERVGNASTTAHGSALAHPQHASGRSSQSSARGTRHTNFEQRPEHDATLIAQPGAVKS
jgi:hypothetical protein